MPGFQLNWRITIQKDTGSSRNTGGEHVESWVTHSNTWAEKVPARGSEVFQADQQVAVREVHWVVRYDEFITEKMRISYGGDYYHITFIEEIVRGQMLKLYTYKKDNE